MNTEADVLAEPAGGGGVVTPQRGEQRNSIDIHPAATLLPSPSPEEYERLKEDIRKSGLRVPVVLTADGRILDGRSRVRACTELGMAYATRNATIDEMLDPPAFVLSMNAARRHMTGDQIIAVYLQANAAKVEAEKQEAKVAQQAGLKKGTTRPVSTTVKPTGKTAEKIAKAVGKSKSAVERVQRVQKVAPEKLADVAAGKVSAAKVLKKVQDEVVDEGELTDEVMRIQERDEALEGAVYGIEIDTDWVEKDVQYLSPKQIARLKTCHRRLGALLRAEAKPEPAVPEAAGDPAEPEP